MKKQVLLFLLVLGCSLGLQAAPEMETHKSVVVSGSVKDQKSGEPIRYALVNLVGTTIATTTDGSGGYVLKNLPVGNFRVKVSLIGYKSSEKAVVLKKDQALVQDFEMLESAISLSEVVVSANRNETSRRLAPTLVSVLDATTFERTNSSSLSQGLNFEPGVRVENNCQNCGFSQVRINGLDGQYSQILIDSRPIFSALAGVYGLEQIPANMVDRVEVIRGGGSALYGSSAIGGTINVITKEPSRNEGSVSHTFATFGGNHGNSMENVTSFNGSLVSEDNKAGLMIFGQHRNRDAYFRDLDEFSEIPELNNRALGFRAYFKPSHYGKLSFEFHSMSEARRGGSDLDLPEHESEITEALRHSVNGGSLKYDQFFSEGKGRLSIFGSAQKVKRKSYYGGGQVLEKFETFNKIEEIDELTADQKHDFVVDANGYIKDVETALGAYGRSEDLTYQFGAQHAHQFNKMLFMPAELTVGAEYSGQNLFDRTALSRLNPKVPVIDQKVTTGSFFLQNEWRNDMWSFLIGARADKNSLLDKVILSPRVNVRFNPVEDVNVRLTYSEGFRAPQYFDEDLHTELAGGDPIKRVLSPDLKEERSRSFSGSVDLYADFGENVKANFLVEGFYTILKGRFHAVAGGEKIDDVEIREVQNAPEDAFVMGVNLEGRFAFGRAVQLQLGGTIQRSEYANEIVIADDTDGHAEDGKEISLKNFLRTPSMYSYFVLTYSPVRNFNATISGKHTGSMYVLHEQYEDEEAINSGQLGTVVDGILIRGAAVNEVVKTKSFFELSCKLSYDFKLSKETMLQINGGVQNMTNVFQPDYDTGGGRASSYAYGPMLPRSFFVGTKLSF